MVYILIDCDVAVPRARCAALLTPPVAPGPARNLGSPCGSAASSAASPSAPCPRPRPRPLRTTTTTCPPPVPRTLTVTAHPWWAPPPPPPPPCRRGRRSAMPRVTAHTPPRRRRHRRRRARPTAAATRRRPTRRGWRGSCRKGRSPVWTCPGAHAAACGSRRRRRRRQASPRAAPPPGRRRCVSIFLDKNRRRMGKSQSKRPPKSTQRPPHQVGEGDPLASLLEPLPRHLTVGRVGLKPETRRWLRRRGSPKAGKWRARRLRHTAAIVRTSTASKSSMASP
jgi:hypothetical protein